MRLRGADLNSVRILPIVTMQNLHPISEVAFSRRRFLALTSLALASNLFVNRGVVSSNDATGIHEIPRKDGLFEVMPLPYEYGALEPYIDAETMRLHHDQHYVSYTKNLNGALRKFPELQSKSIEELLANIHALPESVREAVRNNGGGYYNHGQFWRMMGPKGTTPEGAVAVAIHKNFGSLDVLKTKFSAAASSVFGSGWAWLVVKNGGHLDIGTTSNQDSPIMSGVTGIVGKPILGIDVWEHAYYLKYKNERAKYIDSWWNIVNWKTVGRLFVEAVASNHTSDSTSISGI